MISKIQKEFRCNHCNGNIAIPINLPPTTAPCPYCGVSITSPGSETPETPPAAAKTPPPPPASYPPLQSPAAIPPVPSLVSLPVEGPVPVQAQPPPIESVKVEEAPVQAPPPSVKESIAKEASKPIPERSVVAGEPKTGNVELPPQKESRKSRKEKKQLEAALNPKPQSSGLIPALLVLVILSLAGLGGFFYIKHSGSLVKAPVIKTQADDTVAKEMAYINTGWKKEAYELLGNYLAATDSQGKLPHVLNAAELATKIEDFYGGGVIVDSDTPAEAFSIYELSEEDRKRGLFMMLYDQPPQFDMKEFFRPLASLEVQYNVDEADLLLSTLARVENFAMEPVRVHAFFKRTPEGLKLDWEIFAQTKYRTFQNFTELPELGQKGVFRVFIVEDVPDKGRAIPGIRTYRMADPANSSNSARANVKIDSEVGRSLSIINWRGTEENKPITKTATVELTWGGEENAPELQICRFICWEFLGLGGKDNPATASTN